MEIILVIIGFIIAFFSNMFNGSDKKNNDSEPSDQPIDSQSYPSDETIQTADTRENMQQTSQETSPVMTNQSETIEQQEDKQRQQFAGERRTHESQNQNGEHDAPVKKPVTQGRNMKKSVSSVGKMSSQIQKNMTRKGLINGVIMAEILDRPRSLKPYRSIISERNK